MGNGRKRGNIISIHITDDRFSCGLYIKQETYDLYAEILLGIEKEITEALIGTNFDRLDFCDVCAGGIQVRCFHKEIPCYCYIQATLDYDMANRDELVDEFIEMWRKEDNDRTYDRYREFLDYGEKYGWN